MMYEVNIFLTNRYVPIPEVLARERLLVDNAGASGFYHVIARPATSPWKKLPTTCLCMACLLRAGKIAKGWENRMPDSPFLLLASRHLQEVMRCLSGHACLEFTVPASQCHSS